MNTPKYMAWLCACLLLSLIGTSCQKKSLPVLELSPEGKFGQIETELQRISQSSLPDFAPSLYRLARGNAQCLRRKLDQVGRLEEFELAQLRDQMENFSIRAQRTSQRVGPAYPLRNKAIRLNFLRAYYPELFCQAEENYYLLFRMAWEDQFPVEGRRLAEKTAAQYEMLIDRSRQRLQLESRPLLEKYQKATASGFSAKINADHRDTRKLGDADLLYQKLLMDPKEDGANGDIVSAKFVGQYLSRNLLPATRAPSKISIKRRFTDSMELMWQDRSLDESGNRIYRSTDGLNWELLTDVGPVNVFEEFYFTDTGLLPDTKYCYRVETYYPDGEKLVTTNECAYTPDVTNVPVWRLQLRIKVADLPHAGLDDLLGVTVGYSTAVNLQNTQFLDYGQDDFRRGSHFVYDIDLGGNIRDFNDLTDLLVFVRVGDILIEEIALLANEREIYFRHFGQTYASAQKIDAGTPLAISHEELRCHDNWESYVNSYQASGDKGLFILAPLLIYQDGSLVIKIPKEHIASRMESCIGHILNVSGGMQGSFRWREQLYDQQVSVSKKDFRTLSVDLDLETSDLGSTNTALDLGFDLKLELAGGKCKDKVSVAFKPGNFRTNIASGRGGAILSETVYLILEQIAESFAGGASCGPAFNPTFEAPNPESFDGHIRYLRIRVDQDGNVVIGVASGA